MPRQELVHLMLQYHFLQVRVLEVSRSTLVSIDNQQLMKITVFSINALARIIASPFRIKLPPSLIVVNV